MQINDVVEVLVNLPEIDVSQGMQGTIVEIYTEPRLAYEIEFDYDGSREPETAVLMPEQLRLVWTSPNGPWHT